MKIPGSLPPTPPVSSRVGRAYGLPVRAPAPPTIGPTDRPNDEAALRHPAGSADLRSVLNDEERAYFDQIAALGPITYGPGRKTGPTPGAPRGLRLDVQG